GRAGRRAGRPGGRLSPVRVSDGPCPQVETKRIHRSVGPAAEQGKAANPTPLKTGSLGSLDPVRATASAGPQVVLTPPSEFRTLGHFHRPGRADGDARLEGPARGPGGPAQTPAAERLRHVLAGRRPRRAAAAPR